MAILLRRGFIPDVSGQTFLLDTLSATALVAYSSRKLRSAYSSANGACSVVTSAAGHAAGNIGFNAMGDFDTAGLTTFMTNNGGTNHDIAVQTFYDQSGAGISDASLANTGGVPQNNALPLTNNGVNITQNGHVTAQGWQSVDGVFGIDGYFGNGPSGLGMTNVSSIAQPITICMCFKLLNSTPGAHLCDGISGTAERLLIGFNNLASPATAYQQFAGAGPNTGGTPDLNCHTLIAVFNHPGSAGSIYIDGSSVLSGDPGANTLFGTGGGGVQGAFSATRAYFCEVLYFSSVISGPGAGSDMDKIRASWQSYWGAA